MSSIFSRPPPENELPQGWRARISKLPGGYEAYRERRPDLSGRDFEDWEAFGDWLLAHGALGYAEVGHYGLPRGAAIQDLILMAEVLGPGVSLVEASVALEEDSANLPGLLIKVWRSRLKAATRRIHQPQSLY